MAQITVNELTNLLVTMWPLQIKRQRSKKKIFFFPPVSEDDIRLNPLPAILKEIPPLLKEIVTSFGDTERVLSSDEKEQLVNYLATQWEEIRAINPRIYFTDKPGNLYKLNIALAKLLAEDKEVRKQHPLDQSFHTLLIPTAKNKLNIFEQPISIQLNVLHYVNDYIVDMNEIFEKVQLSRNFCNPFENWQPLPTTIIEILCTDPCYAEKIESAIRPLLNLAKQIPSEILETLYQALLQVIHSKEDPEHVYQTFINFKALLDNTKEHKKFILALINPARDETIEQMIAAIEASDRNQDCLLTVSTQICNILLSAKHSLIAQQYLASAEEEVATDAEDSEHGVYSASTVSLSRSPSPS